MQQVVDTINQIPPVTRILMAGILLLGILERVDFVPSGQRFAWIPAKSLAEPWRPFTALLYNGSLDFALLMRLHQLYTFSQALEAQTLSASRYSKLVASLGAFILILAPLLSLKYLGSVFSAALTYVWSRKYPEQRFGILGLIDIQAAYFFFVQFGYMAVLHPHTEVILSFLLAALAGHLVFFIDDALPILTGKQLL